MESIGARWTGLAKRTRAGSKNSRKERRENRKRQRQKKSDREKETSLAASAAVCNNARKRRWMKVAIRPAKEKAERMEVHGKIPRDIKEHAKVVSVTTKEATIRQAIGEWERQMDELRREDNKKMMRDRHTKMDELRRNREEKEKDLKKKGELIRSLMGITRESEPAKAVHMGDVRRKGGTCKRRRE